MIPRKSLTVALAVSLVVLVLPAAVMAASVSVECAYRDSPADVVCEAYADTSGTGGLRSAGVQLTTTNCTATGATKNTDVWFLGDSAPGFPYDNSPDLTDLKAPNLIVGQFDTSPSATVVTGTRVYMGSVTFARDDSALPDITAELARGGGDFVSFVDAVSGDPVAVTINTIVAERGDVNHNGEITNVDMGLTRNIILNSGYSIFADVNGDGNVTNVDMGLIRNKILGL